MSARFLVKAFLSFTWQRIGKIHTSEDIYDDVSVLTAIDVFALFFAKLDPVRPQTPGIFITQALEAFEDYFSISLYRLISIVV